MLSSFQYWQPDPNISASFMFLTTGPWSFCYRHQNLSSVYFLQYHMGHSLNVCWAELHVIDVTIPSFIDSVKHVGWLPRFLSCVRGCGTQSLFSRCFQSRSTKLLSLVAQMVKNLPAVWETQVWSLGQEAPLEKGIATHSSILAWRIPWTVEPGGLQSMRLQRVGHSWATKQQHYSTYH